MNYKQLLSVILFIYATIGVAGPLSLQEKRNLARNNLLKKHSDSAFVSSTHTTGHFDHRLASQTFHWNVAKIPAIPLDAAKPLSPQYHAALTRYFKQTAYSHGATKTAVEQARLTHLHDTGRGGLIAQFQQSLDGIDVFGRKINLLINRDNALLATAGYFSPVSGPLTFQGDLSTQQAISQFINQTAQAGLAQQTDSTYELVSSDSIKLTEKTQFEQLSVPVRFGTQTLTTNSRIQRIWFPLTDKTVSDKMDSDKMDSDKTESDEIYRADSSSAGQVTAAFYFEAETSQANSQESQLIAYVIDAQTGKILFKNNLSAHVTTTYKVFAEISNNHLPFDGPQGISLTPHPTGQLEDTPNIGAAYVAQNLVTLDHGPISTQDPWLSPADTATVGNNVNAYADISGNDGFDENDIRPLMTGPNAFEYDFEAFQAGLTGDAQKHAVVNLFYVNNFLHDWFYDNGFDESAGNAQQLNYGRGGLEGDRMKVEAQDFAFFNNARMTVPKDGQSPRMELYIFNRLNDAGIEVSGITNIETGIADFGPTDFDVSGTLTLVDDEIDPPGDGCESISTNLSQRVAIIDRGDCLFTVKVKNAQDAGAVAVIIVNHNATGEAGGGVIPMGGDDASVLIPSFLVSLEKGDEIKASLNLDANLQARLFRTIKPLDSTLDNGIIAHEWGHYLSHRLVGDSNGLFNSQGRGMGEGWSDFVALLMQIRKDDNLIAGNENYQGVYSAATFIADAYFGNRRVPYSTDMNKNALTLRHIENGVSLPLHHPVAFGVSGGNNAEVHNTGEVWATVLWDVFIGLVNRPDYQFEQVREVMKDYLVASLKMTPISPTILEARDALLAVVLANSVEDFYITRDAFSRRGMGAAAIAPLRESDDHQGVVEDFTAGLDVSAQLIPQSQSIELVSCDQDGVLDAGEVIALTLTMKNYSASNLPGFDVNLTSTNDVTFSPEQLEFLPFENFAERQSRDSQVALNSASFMQAINLQAEVAHIGNNPDDFIEPDDVQVSILSHFDFNLAEFSDDMSVEETSRFDWQSQVSAPVLKPFVIDNGAWHGVDNDTAGASDLVTPLLRVAADGDFDIAFDHYYFFESSDDGTGTDVHYDGGVIEVSVDGGPWQDVIEFGAVLSQPYNGQVDSSNPIIGGRMAYTHTREENNFSMSPNRLTFPEGSVSGQNIRVRFRIGTDASKGDLGWLIDNVVVTNALSPMFSEIVAEDNLCLSAHKPQPDAGDDIVIVPEENQPQIDVILSGTATDADGDLMTIEWLQRAGPDVTLSAASTLQTGFSIDTPTEDVRLVFELRINDGGHSVSDLVNVDINLNKAPDVSVLPVTVAEGALANLIAVANDPEGDRLSFRWRQLNGPTVSLSSETAQQVSFTAPQVEQNTELSFEVIANDGRLDSVPAIARVTVNNSESRISGSGAVSSLLLAGLCLLLRVRRVGILPICVSRRSGWRS